jgi:hypothetical protein
MKSILMIGLALMTPLTAQVPVEVVVLNKFVTGAPFSAVAVTESTQTLADGNRIAHKSQARPRGARARPGGSDRGSPSHR